MCLSPATDGAALTMLDLAGWRVRLACRPAEFAAETATHYAPFAAAGDASPHLTIEVTLVGNAAASAPEAAQPAWNGTVWLLDASGFSGRIDLAQARAALTLDSATPQVHLEYFLRVLLALLAQHEDGLLIHAAGLLMPATGQVYLFIGCSGSGKSTVVRLSSGKGIALNDDLILVRPEGGDWMAYGTPFWNAETGDRAGQTARGLVAGVYVLIQDGAVYLEPCSPALATAELAINCPVANGDPTLASNLLARCRTLAETVPVRRLHFRKDPDFWQFLQPVAAEVGDEHATRNTQHATRNTQHATRNTQHATRSHNACNSMMSRRTPQEL
ncbi:MAG: hypothetical protein NT169_23415 [Chloroflexi bacterium]|nr:hypothetical protein [Chloroflexota bacterium]